MHYIAYIFGAIIILVGIKSVLTQQATLTIQLWGNSSNAPHRRDNGGYSTSEHTGFMAILIGIGEIATGVLMIAKGPAYFGEKPQPLPVTDRKFKLFCPANQAIQTRLRPCCLAA